MAFALPPIQNFVAAIPASTPGAKPIMTARWGLQVLASPLCNTISITPMNTPSITHGHLRSGSDPLLKCSSVGVGEEPCDRSRRNGVVSSLSLIAPRAGRAAPEKVWGETTERNGKNRSIAVRHRPIRRRVVTHQRQRAGSRFNHINRQLYLLMIVAVIKCKCVACVPGPCSHEAKLRAARCPQFSRIASDASPLSGAL